MFSNSMRRKGRGQWRYFLGLSVLGLLLIASASHAAHPVAGTSAPLQLELHAGVP